MSIKRWCNGLIEFFNNMYKYEGFLLNYPNTPEWDTVDIRETFVGGDSCIVDDIVGIVFEHFCDYFNSKYGFSGCYCCSVLGRSTVDWFLEAIQKSVKDKTLDALIQAYTEGELARNLENDDITWYKFVRKWYKEDNVDIYTFHDELQKLLLSTLL